MVMKKKPQSAQKHHFIEGGIIDEDLQLSLWGNSKYHEMELRIILLKSEDYFSFKMIRLLDGSINELLEYSTEAIDSANAFIAPAPAKSTWYKNVPRNVVAAPAKI